LELAMNNHSNILKAIKEFNKNLTERESLIQNNQFLIRDSISLIFFLKSLIAFKIFV
jgi:prephenate dehydrogenase